MNMILTFHTIAGLVLMMGMSLASLVFANISRAEVPLLDTMTPERVETATFSLG